MVHAKQHESGERGGRGRGRGRGGRGGRDETQDEYKEQEDSKVEEVAEKESFKSVDTHEKKLAMLYQFVYKYILQRFKAGDYANEEFKMP